MPQYQIFSYANALIPKPRVGYLVDKILPAGSLSVWYGYPGSLKSNLVMDMAMAVATGSNFLPAMPNSGNNFNGYATVKSPVLWIDLDNGDDVVEERLRAFGSVYKAGNDTELWYMPFPNVRASSYSSMNDFYSFIDGLPIKPQFIIVDTLLRMAKVKDENSSEMDTVMYHIRKLAEDLKATLALISHANKANQGRAGNALRGHSSIEGGVDFVFRVKRDGNSDIIDVENEKARRKPIDPFSARWTYDVDPISDELISARFYQDFNQKVSKQQQAMTALVLSIRQVLLDNGKLNKSQIYAHIRGSRPAFEAAIQQAVTDGHIYEIPNLFKNAKIYDAK